VTNGFVANNWSLTENRIADLSIGMLMCSWIALLMAAAPRAESTPEGAIREANAAFLRGDLEDADRGYAASEECAQDPGLVAFNRAAVLFQRGDYREAELHYARVLADAECPAERAAKSWYNRGTSLLRRGVSTAVYRSAIACFDRCLESTAADEPLKADARYNLELAKILWNESRKSSAKPENPNENPPPEDFPNDPPKTSDSDRQPELPEPGEGNTGGKSLRAMGQQGATSNAGANANPTQNARRNGSKGTGKTFATHSTDLSVRDYSIGKGTESSYMVWSRTDVAISSFTDANLVWDRPQPAPRFFSRSFPFYQRELGGSTRR
jgi:tetratricopeptide (TPR) repeat protein